jgi:AraC-like DNA-binding protein
MDELSSNRKIMNPLPCDFPHGWRINRTTTDPDQMKEFAVGWSIEQTQLEAGKYLGRICGVHTRMIQLGLSEHSVSTHIHGAAPDGSVVLALRLPSPRPTSFRGQRLELREMAIIRSGEEIDSLHAGAAQILTVAIQQSYADQIARSHGAESFHQLFPRDKQNSISPDGFAATGQQLLRLLDQISQNDPPFADAAAGDRFEHRLIATLFAQIDFNRIRQNGPGPRNLAKLAETYLHQHPCQALDLLPLCRELSSTPRTVQLSFSKTFGLSMKSYAQALRFNGARRDLLAAHPAIDSVKAVAIGWGFRHLGRFSSDYFRWFGECPSITLAKC